MEISETLWEIPKATSRDLQGARLESAMTGANERRHEPGWDDLQSELAGAQALLLQAESP